MLNVAVGNIDFGNVPAWLALVGGATGLWTYLSGRHTAKMSHAARVYAVITDPASGELVEASLPPAVVKLRNSGELPIYDARVSLWTPGGRRAHWRFCRHRWWTGTLVKSCHYRAIEPGQEVTNSDVLVVNGQLGASPPSSPALFVTFRDGNGRRWVRWPDGRLNSLRSWQK